MLLCAGGWSSPGSVAGTKATLSWPAWHLGHLGLATIWTPVTSLRRFSSALTVIKLREEGCPISAVVVTTVEGVVVNTVRSPSFLVVKEWKE